MGFWRATTTILVVVQAMSILSFARGMSIIARGEKNGPGTLLRSEEEIEQLFEEWMVVHDKSYTSREEEMSRFDIFKDNLRFIDEHNDPRHNHTYTLALNHFSDLTNEEYRATYLTKYNLSELVAGPISSRYKAGKLDQLPASVDWRDQGAVAAVKFQGVCESCWAFSAVSTVESLNQIMTGSLITLSEQELVDCDASNNGCHRGFPHKAYRYMVNTGGIETDTSYPYISQNGVEGACRMNKANAVSIDRYEYGPMKSEQSMKKALASQTISVAVESAGRAFQSYGAGIFHGQCGTAIDHAVVLVGYGTDRNGEDYWILRNSWSERWGENGYMRIPRNTRSREGKCGVAKYFTYPVMNVFPKEEMDDTAAAAAA